MFEDIRNKSSQHDIREEPSMWRLPSRDIREGFDGREAPGDRGEASKTGFAWLQHPDGR